MFSTVCEVLPMAAKAPQSAPVEGAQSEPQALPLDGYTRWNDLKRIIPLSHESIRQRELKGRFPKRVQLGSARCVAWKNSEIHRWLSDPSGYCAPQAA
jgi:prophage regulatory protein